MIVIHNCGITTDKVVLCVLCHMKELTSCNVNPRLVSFVGVKVIQFSYDVRGMLKIVIVNCYVSENDLLTRFRSLNQSRKFHVDHQNADPN